MTKRKELPTIKVDIRGITYNDPEYNHLETIEITLSGGDAAGRKKTKAEIVKAVYVLLGEKPPR